MAVVKIWKVKSNLNKVIDYVSDENKTLKDEDSSLLKELHQVIEYTTDSFKTEEKCYVTGINCIPATAYQDMIDTKKRFQKTDGILAYHSYQSFKEGEVTPEIAHEIGVKLADEMWGDRFEVVVSTHLNTNHIHNHFVLNSVSFLDGKKYYDNRSNYAEMRAISDSLCEEYHLSVLPEKKCKSGINYSYYSKKNLVNTNYYKIVKNDLDLAIKLAYTYEDFERIMKSWNYELFYRSGNLTVRKYPYRKNIRVFRNYGEEYSINRIKERIKIEFFKTPNKKKLNYSSPPYFNLKHSYLYKKYIHYLYLLKIYPKKYPRSYVSPKIRAEARKMNMLSDEVRLLVANDIKNHEQFFLYQNKVNNQLDILLHQKNILWNRYKKTEDIIGRAKIKVEIDTLYQKIKKVRKEVVLCRDIEERTPKIIDNLEQQEKEINLLNERKGMKR